MRAINKNLSLSGCWRMVNAIQNGKTRGEIIERCSIAEAWLTANMVINNSQYDELMRAVSYIYREAY